MKDVLIGIDAGTSGVKVAVFSPDGTLLRKEQRSISILTSANDRAEVDLDQYWDKVCQALRVAVADVQTVAGIGLSTTTPTTVLFNKSLKPVGNGILYMDNRAAGELLEVELFFGGRSAYFRRMGNRLSVSTCAAVNLRWIMENEPDRWDSAAHAGYLNSYLAAKLTGETGIDYTTASYSGLYPLPENNDCWSEDILDFFGLNDGKLLPLISPSSCVGRTTGDARQQTGLPEGIPVAMGSADTAAATFALGLKNGGEAFESAGTSGVITFVLDKPNFNQAFMNRRHVIDNRWLAHGAMSMSGGSLLWAQSNIWPELKSVAELEKEALLSPPGAGGIVFLPYLAGERSPIWNPDASGTWFGLTRNTGRPDMIRAVFEASAYAMRQLMEEARKTWGWYPETIMGVGGGVQSSLWNRIKADVMSVRYATSENSDAAALGAALMGGIAGGMFADTGDSAIPRLESYGQPLEPDKAVKDVYHRMFDIYTSLYPRLESSMRTLANIRRNI